MRKVHGSVMITPKILKILEKFKLLAHVVILVALVGHIHTKIKEGIVRSMMDDPKGLDISLEGNLEE